MAIVTSLYVQLEVGAKLNHEIWRVFSFYIPHVSTSAVTCSAVGPIADLATSSPKEMEEDK